jgi:hypothetical protein
MPKLISCANCGEKAIPKSELTRDGKIHYDCEGGHSFHRTLAGDPVQFSECGCSNFDTTRANQA